MIGARGSLLAGRRFEDRSDPGSDEERMAAKSTMTKLEIENEALRALSIKLGRIVLTGAGTSSGESDNIRMPIFEALGPDQIASALRELALEYERLVRISKQSGRAEEFEEIGIEFADMAAKIEAAFRLPGVAR
jgi:hypothetical protein